MVADRSAQNSLKQPVAELPDKEDRVLNLCRLDLYLASRDSCRSFVFWTYSFEIGMVPGIFCLAARVLS
jgi:hypothetical protein